jgi:hypothetical protein
MHAEFSWASVKEGDGLEGLGVSWEDNIQVDVREIGGGPWAGLIWFIVGKSGRFL